MGGWLGDSVDEGTNKVRTMEQILEDEKTQNNILELHIQKLNVISDEGDDAVQKAKNLTFEDFGELLFEVLKIKGI